MTESKLSCDCVRGFYLCREAVRLWNLYSQYYYTRDYKKADRYKQKYEMHFKK